MLQRLRSFAQRESPRLFADLIVVIIGITLSLSLHDWRQDRADRTQELRLLQDLAGELEHDLEDIERRIEMLDTNLALVRRAARRHGRNDAG